MTTASESRVVISAYDVLPREKPTETVAKKSPDFSLVLGGPLFTICRRAHLAGSNLQRMHREALVLATITWLPLLLLSALQGYAWGGVVSVPFLHDIEANVRFLVALPVLVVAEVIVHTRISPLICRFTDRGIVVNEDLPRFDAALNSALRVRDSFAVEGILLGLIYTFGLWVWRSHFALGGSSWYEISSEKPSHLTLAGYWYVFVSIPILQFILLRWYVRLAIWFLLLYRISRLNLRLTSDHPDRSGGIGFLGECAYAFGPVLFAQGVLLSGLIASRVMYEGRPLLSFKMEAVGFVVFAVLTVLAPLLMFTPQLELAKLQGSAEYGRLANRYHFYFEEKWIRPADVGIEELPGAAELKPMVELGNVYSNIRRMRLVPFGLGDITRLAAATATPLLPLLLTAFSPAEVANFLIRVVFK